MLYPRRANSLTPSGTYHADKHSLDCGERVNKNVLNLDERRVVRAHGNACELNMSDGLIMKGSPPSAGRRTTAKQPVTAKKGASRATASSSAASGKTSGKAAQKARPVAGKAKPAGKAAPAASRAPAKAPKIVKPKIVKAGSVSASRAAASKMKPGKGPGPKKPPAHKTVAAKAPEIPAKAGAAKAARPSSRVGIVERTAADVKSGVNMKGNSTPDKTARAAKSEADHRAAASNVVMLKPQPAAAKIVLPDNYRPTETEPFMNPMQRHYFRLKLLNWKEEILRQTRETLQGMHEDTVQYADLADRATSETDRALELRARDRQRKLIAKIDAALARIEDGTYGYCEDSGEPIGLKRLDARPIATLSLEAQERHERRERVHRGD